MADDEMEVNAELPDGYKRSLIDYNMFQTNKDESEERKKGTSVWEEGIPPFNSESKSDLQTLSLAGQKAAEEIKSE